MDDCFFTIEEDLPLAIWWAADGVCGAVNLDEFLSYSLVGMSKEQGDRYADRLQEFVDLLRDRI